MAGATWLIWLCGGKWGRKEGMCLEHSDIFDRDLASVKLTGNHAPATMSRLTYEIETQ